MHMLYIHFGIWRYLQETQKKEKKKEFSFTLAVFSLSHCLFIWNKNNVNLVLSLPPFPSFCMLPHKYAFLSRHLILRPGNFFFLLLYISFICKRWDSKVLDHEYSWQFGNVMCNCMLQSTMDNESARPFHLSRRKINCVF